MLVKIDFYKSTGKWHSEGRVEIESNPWESGVLDDIICNQEVLVRHWYKNTSEFLVVSDIPESSKDPNYRMTYNRLYLPEQIRYRGVALEKKGKLD